jgi:hypothetical protein
MIKELFLAIALGALLGFGITGGYLALNQKNTSKNTPATITEPTVIPTISNTVTPTTTPSSQLSISSPEDNLLVSTSKLNIIGTTIANSHIVITTATKTFLGQSDAQGNFNVSIDLDSGLNIIKISSIDSTDSQLDSQLNITYSTTKI